MTTHPGYFFSHPNVEHRVARVELAADGPRNVPACFDFTAVDFLNTFHVKRINLLEAVMADPARGVPVAKLCGIGDEMFDDDTVCLWVAAGLAQHLPRRSVYRLARRALKQEGFWIEDQIAGNYGMIRWGNSTLTQLFDAAPFSNQLVTVTSAALVEHHRRWTEATVHFRYAVKILEVA